MKIDKQRINRRLTTPEKGADKIEYHSESTFQNRNRLKRMKCRGSRHYWIAVVVVSVGIFELIHVSDFGRDVHRLQTTSAQESPSNDLPSEGLTSFLLPSIVKNATTTKSKKTKVSHYYRSPSASNSNNDTFGGVQARAFDKNTVPCFEPESKWKEYTTQMTPTREGFLFLKTYKTGSSTASGIDLRIARNVARRQNTGFDVCKTRYDHAWASALYHSLDRNKSFLWTILRDPTSRAVSQLFHFHVSREKQNTTDDSLIGRIRKDNGMFRDYYVSSLSLQGYKGKSDPVQVANEIIQQYDFIAVTERMDESAVALAMLLDIPLGDVLFLKAKGNGGYDDAGGGGGCTYITPSFVSEGMNAFFRTDEYQDMVQWDYLLYSAVNKSLDLTIDRLGREKFEQNLLKYKNAQEIAVERCLSTTRFPCSASGKKNNVTDCLWNDSGCGYECLDRVADELGLSR